MAQALRRGARQEEFAQRFGVSQQQISQDLKELDRRWKATQLTEVDAQRRRQLEQLAEVRREAWRAWQASQQERVETVTERVGPPSSEGPAVRQVARISKKPPEWAVSALATILNTLNAEADLLGTKAAVRAEHSGPDGGPLQTQASIEVRAVDYRAAIAALRPDTPPLPATQQGDAAGQEEDEDAQAIARIRGGTFFG